MGARLATALGFTVATAWRSECDIEGLDVQVTIHGFGSDAEDAPACRVVWLDHQDLQKIDASALAGVDYVFTDSRLYAPFRGRNGALLFLENISEFHVPQDLDGIMERKSELLSVLMPSRDRWDDLATEIHRQAMELLPQHVFIDDGDEETLRSAFESYRFCLIPEDDVTRHSISPLFIRSLAYHTIAVFNGFVEVGSMVFNAIADFDPEDFSLPETIETLHRHNKHIGALWHYQRIIQDQVLYRYNRPFEEKLFSQACTMCRLLADGVKPQRVFVGIYSARRNFEKRQAVRETWGRLLRETYGLRYRFFLGEASAGASNDERRMRREMEEHNDLVFLPVTEGYRMNSRKGLLFLEWIAERTEAEFLLKTDDDVYLRPAPLLRQLEHRIPAQYAWAIFDYISPVPRDEEDNFYNPEETFPFPVFPPYPRGVVRVLSMDVVRLLAKASQEVQCMDSSHVALVSLLLRESAFSEFKCDRPVSLGMNIDSLSKILKMTGANDSLKIRHQTDADTVNFQCEGSDDRIADFDLKLMTIESEHMEIPEQHYKVVAKLPSAEFQKVCRDLKEFGETIQIQGTKEGLKFMVQGDLGSGNVMLKPREGEKPEEKVSLTVHEPVTATFALRYLVNFSKAEKLCGSVELGLGPDAPLLVKYDLESSDKGHMQFYLAPKIDE